MANDFRSVMPLTHIVKRLIIINVAIWVLLILIAQRFMPEPYIFNWFGFTPIKFFTEMWIWQPFTYMFLHSENLFHLLFNMLLLWWLGGELENYWGRKYFIYYYLSCGLGSALIYFVCLFCYYLISGDAVPLMSPVVGASGAIYGLILAYGLIFGERVVYFLMMFPMKAKYFTLIIAGVELMNILSQGFSSQVANLAHLGGIIMGFLLLRAGPRLREFLARKKSRAHGRKLKLVVDNDSNSNIPGKGPRYWN